MSELNHPAFRDRVLTFESNPSWVNLTGSNTIVAKVNVCQRAPWGGSTNVEAAFKRILDVVIEHKLPASEVPDLILFSDMQFDEATGTGGGGHYDQFYRYIKDSGSGPATQLENIKRMFHDAGKHTRRLHWTLFPHTSQASRFAVPLTHHQRSSSGTFVAILQAIQPQLDR